MIYKLFWSVPDLNSMLALASTCLGSCLGGDLWGFVSRGIDSQNCILSAAGSKVLASSSPTGTPAFSTPQLAEPLNRTQWTDSGPILSRTLRGRIARRHGSLPVYVSSLILHEELS